MSASLVERLGELAQVLGASEPRANLKMYRTTCDSPNALEAGRTAGAVERGKWATDRLCS